MALTAREHLASATMIANHELLTQLEKTQSALESLVRGMHDFVCLATSEGRIIWGNDRAEQWLDCGHDALHSGQLSQLLPLATWSDFQSRLQSDDAAGLSGRDSEFEMELTLAGQARQILWSIRPFKEMSVRRGRVLLILGRDVTEVLAERSARARLEAELETAQLLQAAFFPHSYIERPQLEIAAYYRAADKCSGDWWGHFVLGDHLDLVCIADVSGHGAASALVTAMTQATCMNFASQFREKGESCASPAMLFEQLNQVIYQTFRGGTFMTFFALLFDTDAGQVVACNAAHNFPSVLRQLPSGSPGADNRGPPEPLMLGGNPLGSESDPVYAVKSWPLGPCDRFVLFTDGLIECRSAEGKPFATGGLRRSMMKHKNQDCRAFRDAVTRDALHHFGNCPLSDDVSLLVIDLRRS